LAWRQSHASQSLLDSARRLSRGFSAMSRRMNSMSAAVSVRPRYFSSLPMPRTITEVKTERKSYLHISGQRAGLTRFHVGAPRAAVGSPAARSTCSWCASSVLDISDPFPGQ
jgi:hypothetical protein